MCSFLVYCLLLSKNKLEKANKKLSYRGPDYTSIVFHENVSFLHNLLNITGTIRPQPFIKNNVYLLYNGEIYNYKDFGTYESDGECLIHLYLEHGPDFAKLLDGEFVICLIDFNKNIALVATDPFRTKPVYYSVDPVFSCSSFKAPLEELGANNVLPFPANTISVFDLSSKLIISSKRTYEFDLTQYKTSYDDWITAFEKAVLKRATITNTLPYICLSSGYDSGGMCSALQNLKCKYSIYSITANENLGIFKQREAFIDPLEINYVSVDSNDLSGLMAHIENSTENNKTKIWENGNYFDSLLYDDKACLGIAKICQLAKESENRVYLSGSGADEIMSDYAVHGVPVYSHSCFSGVFPEHLESIFPKDPVDTECIWKSFYKSTQEAYLMKEEYIGGSFGIEGRYPYLDKQVVQEFLWLTPELKNKSYKAPLMYYLTLHNFPFEKEVKRGFSPF